MSQPRFVVVGAGAIGGVVGAALHRAGHDVLLVARGAHGAAIADRGLTLETPDGVTTSRIPVVGDAATVDYRDGDITLLAVKTQDTAGALHSVRSGGGAGRPVVCLQNGVVNEAMALRVAPHVYGVAVMCPGEHLEPGLVTAFSSPVLGLLDIGAFPAVPAGAADATAGRIAAAFRDAGFLSDVVADVMRAKYSKLLLNLGNAIEVVCGPSADTADLFGAVHDEGRRVLSAAGIAFDEGVDPRRTQMRLRPVDGRRREGGSSWQSVSRHAGSIETDYLSGEIVLTARRHGLDAPANRVLQDSAAAVAAGALPPGSCTPDEVLARIEQERRTTTPPEEP